MLRSPLGWVTIGVMAAGLTFVAGVRFQELRSPNHLTAQPSKKPPVTPAEAAPVRPRSPPTAQSLLLERDEAFAKLNETPSGWGQKRLELYSTLKNQHPSEVLSLTCRASTCRLHTRHPDRKSAEQFLDEMDLSPQLVGANLMRYPIEEARWEFAYFVEQPKPSEAP
jgi:hypothetical protein